MRSFNTAIVDDPLFAVRSSDCKLIYFILYNHPKNHLCGLLQISEQHLAIDCSLPLARIKPALAELADFGFLKMDPPRQLIWVPEMRRVVGDVGSKIEGAVKKYLKGLRPCSLVGEVCVAFGIEYAPTDTLSGKPGYPIQTFEENRNRVQTGSVSGIGSVSGTGSENLARAASPPMREVFSGENGEPGVNKPLPSPKTVCDVQGSRPPEPQVPPAVQAGLPGLIPAASPGEPKKRNGKALAARVDAPPTRKTWEAYANAYAQKYGVLPTPNARVNGQLAQLVKDMGAADAPKIAEFYLTRNTSFYVTQHHPIGLLLRDAQGLRVEMLTGATVNAETAKNDERTEANPAAQLLAELRRKKS